MRNLDRDELEMLQNAIQENLGSVGAFDWLTQKLSHDEQEELLEDFNKDFIAVGDELLTEDERDALEDGAHLDSDITDDRWATLYDYYGSDSFDEVCKKLDSDTLQEYLEDICKDYDAAYGVDILGETFGAEANEESTEDNSAEKEEALEKFIEDTFLKTGYGYTDTRKLPCMMTPASNEDEEERIYFVDNLRALASCDVDSCYDLKIEYELSVASDPIPEKAKKLGTVTLDVLDGEIEFFEPSMKEVGIVAGQAAMEIGGSFKLGNFKSDTELTPEQQSAAEIFAYRFSDELLSTGRAAYKEAMKKEDMNKDDR